MVWFICSRKYSKEIVSKLNAEILKSLAEPETKEKLLSIGLMPIGSSPENLAQQIKMDIEKFTVVANATKI